MILEFNEPHLSIKAFAQTKLPSFTIVTGVNGSGKSHLLEAIEGGKVTLSDLDKPRIVRFTNSNFSMDNEGEYSFHQVSQDKLGTWNFFQKKLQPQAASWRASIGERYKPLKEDCLSKKTALMSVDDAALGSYKENLKNWFMHPTMRGNHNAQGLFSFAHQIPFAIDDIDKDTFMQLYKPYRFKNDFLPLQLGIVFWDYYLKLRQNELNEFENAKHGKEYSYLSESDFSQRHGEKPWVLVNRILDHFGTISYRVKSPDNHDMFSPFSFRLCHTENPNLEVSFDTLSSGEKIVMALVASAYKADSDLHFPDVLLLDEIDASLHPSMIKNLLKVISDIFVQRGVQVILATHSPTTIALAPEDSVFLMQPYGETRLVKSNRQDALRELTQGFATIEEGLKLFDQVSPSHLTIITEGNNAAYLKTALEHRNIGGVEVMRGLEDITSKEQLRTLFRFFRKAPHDGKVLFVWDCDATFANEDGNNTFSFIFPVNENNALAQKGIENLFSESLFSDFITETRKSTGELKRTFDSSRKRDFEKFVLGRSQLDDFLLFEPLFERVAKIKQL